MPDQVERPLTDAEATVLTHLLLRDFPGVEQLRTQAQAARVVGRCTCGCASLDVSVDQGTASSEDDAIPRMIVSATSTDPRCSHPLLWVHDHADGRRVLSGIELAWIDGPPTEFPPPEAFDLPEPKARYFPVGLAPSGVIRERWRKPERSTLGARCR